MATLPLQITELLKDYPGKTDREITNILRTVSDPQQPVNSAARILAFDGVVIRRKRQDGLIGNYLVRKSNLATLTPKTSTTNGEKNQLAEDEPNLRVRLP